MVVVSSGQVKKNASACADELVKLGYTIATGGTVNHLLLWWVLLLVAVGAAAGPRLLSFNLQPLFCCFTLLCT